MRGDESRAVRAGRLWRHLVVVPVAMSLIPSGRAAADATPPGQPPAAAAAPAPSGPPADAPQPAAAAPAPPAPPEPKTVVTLRGDRLTINVTELPLDDVLKRITDPSRAELRGSVQAPRNVSAEFSDVSLQEGLARLLGEQNFLLTYREDGSLRSVTLLGDPIEPSADARVVKTTPQPAAPATIAPSELLQRSVPVGGKLQQFVGQPTATLQQLLDITLRQDDAVLRREAMRTAMNAIDSQADLRATVVKSLEHTDDQTFAHLMRSLGQERAPEIISHMASGSRTPEIRARGLQLLRTMNAQETADEP